MLNKLEIGVDDLVIEDYSKKNIKGTIIEHRRRIIDRKPLGEKVNKWWKRKRSSGYNKSK